MAESRFPLKPLAWGLGVLAVGFALVFLGYNVIGIGDSTSSEVLAGLSVVLGLTLVLVSVFVFLLPPLLPSK